MDKILSTIGACTVIAIIFFLIKTINSSLISKNENNKTYKIDKGDDE